MNKCMGKYVAKGVVNMMATFITYSVIFLVSGVIAYYFVKGGLFLLVLIWPDIGALGALIALALPLLFFLFVIELADLFNEAREQCGTIDKLD